MKNPETSPAEVQILSHPPVAPRLTPALIESVIAHEFYFTAGQAVAGQDASQLTGLAAESLNKLTVCVLILVNGFTVTGEAAPVYTENFDVDLGRKLAREHAKQKIWALEGYLLKERLKHAQP